MSVQVWMIFGIIAGIIIYLSISRKFNPSNISGYVQLIFILVTIILLSIGVFMLLFKGLHFLYNIIRQKTSPDYKKAIKYEMDREEYDFWKLRFDEDFWTYMDGLSVEKEISYRPINPSKNLICDHVLKYSSTVIIFLMSGLSAMIPSVPLKTRTSMAAFGHASRIVRISGVESSTSPILRVTMTRIF